MEAGEIVAIIGALAGVGGCATAAVRWLGNHFEGVTKQNQIFQQNILEENKLSRIEFTTASKENTASFATALLQQRDAHVASLQDLGLKHVEAVKAQVDLFARQEERCAQQHEDNQKIIRKLMGLSDSGSWKKPG